jgi:hypothetical protein
LILDREVQQRNWREDAVFVRVSPEFPCARRASAAQVILLLVRDRDRMQQIPIRVQTHQLGSNLRIGRTYPFIVSTRLSRAKATNCDLEIDENRRVMLG